VRIAEIHVYQMDLPVSGKRYRMSLGSYAALDSTIVEIGVSCANDLLALGRLQQCVALSLR
jgi:hypothetical protein